MRTEQSERRAGAAGPHATRRLVLVSQSGEPARAAFAEGVAATHDADIAIELATSAPRGPDIIGVAIGPPARLDAGALADLPDLQVLVAASAGYDHIEIAAARAAGIVVAHTPGYSDVEVADHTIACIAMLLRGIARADRAVRGGEWNARAVAPRRITGSRLGIVGLGRIGRLVLHRALALGMAVDAWAPRTAPAEVRALGARAHAELGELLAACDVVSLHVPLRADTRGLLGTSAFALMRPGSYLVNTGRGELVDLDALGAALGSGRLAGAALDVFDTEPLPADHPARALPNTVLTPHLAWLSPESAYASYRRAGHAVGAALSGRSPEFQL
jgi:D-3-phosphoglycerate dehydrogenase / 2-oxoglutarate reductase